MVNSIIDAIAITLNAQFGDSYKIFTEEKRGHLEEPCFFISCINPTNKLFLGRRYFRENTFVINYFPKNKLQERTECNAVADRLYLCLEWIILTGDPVMGSNMHYEIIDGVLNFFVNYNMFMLKKKDFTLMDTLNLQQKEKKGG